MPIVRCGLSAGDAVLMDSRLLVRAAFLHNSDRRSEAEKNNLSSNWEACELAVPSVQCTHCTAVIALPSSMPCRCAVCLPQHCGGANTSAGSRRRCVTRRKALF